MIWPGHIYVLGRALRRLFGASGALRRTAGFSAPVFAFPEPVRFPDPFRPILNEALDLGAGGIPGVAEDAQASKSGSRARDREPVEELYRRYSPSLYWVCMRYTRNRKDAEDMVHQVFIIVQQRLDRFRGESSIYTWLYRIAVNECLQMLRKRKFDSPGNLEDIPPVPLIAPGAEWDAKLSLDRILGSADAETREIFLLIYLEGLKVEEVVGVMGLSKATIHRKMAAFKIKMEKMK